MSGFYDVLLEENGQKYNNNNEFNQNLNENCVMQ